MITLAIAVQKGGSGKTTSASALGAILAEQGRRVLLVDLDPQASLSQGLGIDAEGASMAEVLGDQKPGTLGLADIVQTVTDSLDLAPSDIALSQSEMGISVRQWGREIALKQALAKLANIYDVCILDCPPSLGILTVNGLAAADGVIVPTQPAASDLRGVRMFLDTLERVQDKDTGINPELELLGILVTQFDGRTIAHKQALEAIEKANLPLMGIIPRSVRAQEQGAAKETLIKYDPQGKPTAAYYEAAEKVTAWLKIKK